MAKQLVNPFERHVEKGVLGIAALALIAVLVKFLVTTPNKLEMGGEIVTPGTIDGKIVQKAEAVRRAIRSKQPEDVAPVEPVASAFRAATDPFTPEVDLASLPAAVAPGPLVPIVDPPFVGQERTRLARVVPVGKAAVTYGLATLVGEGGRTFPANWVTVSAVFDREAQMEILQRTYGTRWRQVVFGKAEIQRRARRSNGTWSDEDWQSVQAWPAARVPKPPEVTLIERDNQFVVSQDEYNRVAKYVDDLAVRDFQLRLLRPLPVEAMNGDAWRFSVITSKEDVALMDHYYLHHDEAIPARAELERYPGMYEAAAETTAEEPKTLTGRDRIAAQFREAEQLLATARQTRDVELTVLAFNLMTNVINDSEATPADKDKARRIQFEADRLAKDIRWEQRIQPGPRSGDPSAPSGESVQVRRNPPAREQFWVHDMAPGSVESGRTYQYRIRPVVFNRLYGVPEKFENPEDALQPFLYGEWSEPSDPIHIPPAYEVYIARTDDRRRNAKMEIFQWVVGVWVQKDFAVQVGEKVEGEARAPIPDPDDPLNSVYHAPISFDGHATVLDIDFDRRVRERLEDRGGIRIGLPQRTTSVVLLDDAGELRERFEIWDKKHPDRLAAKDRVYRAPRGTR